MNAKLVFVLCAIMFACGNAVDCVFNVVSTENGKTYKYDLRKLSHPAGEKDELYYRNDDGSYIYMNICGPSSEKCESGSTVCLREDESGKQRYTSLGKVDTQQVDDASDLEPGKGVQITYSDGDECILGSWQTVVTLSCDATVEGEISSVETGECWYKATVTSKYACGVEVSGGGSDSGNGGSGDVVALVILIVLLCCVVLYFGLGVIYQKKVKEASSPTEYIIHNEFWCSLPGLVRDGVLFIFHGCKRGDYIQV